MMMDLSNEHLVREDLVAATMQAIPGPVSRGTVERIREAICKELKREVDLGRLVIVADVVKEY